MPNPPSVVTIAGPPLLGFFFNLILSGVLIVQVYFYHVGFPNDCVRMKSLVYGVFFLEMLQTSIQCYDKFELYGKEFGNIANLDKGRLSWFSIAILTSFTGGIVQAFLGWKIYSLSKNWFVAVGVWILTLLATGAGMAQGILVRGVLISKVENHIKTSLNIWFITTAVNDFIIAGILTFYLHRMKTGMKRSGELITRIIKLTVETGSITALTAIVIVITAFIAPPWFLILTDCIGKLYANNLMVMFNRRLTIGHVPPPAEIGLTPSSTTFLGTLRTSGRNASSTTTSDIGKRLSCMNTTKPQTAFVHPPSEWDDSPCTEYVGFEPTNGPEPKSWR